MHGILVIALSLFAITSATHITKLGPEAEIIPGSYLVTLKKDVNVRSFIKNQALRRNNGKLVALEEEVEHVWVTVLNGFAAKLDDSEVAMLDTMDEIELIEPDQVMRAYALVTQTGSDWGLSRLSRRTPVSSPYSYTYDNQGGSGSRVYVVDTGTLTTHTNFNGRAVYGTSFVSGQTGDGNGHGTHCSGTVGSTTYGVAKAVTIVGVKVLSDSGSGTNAAVVSGIEWATSNSSGYGRSIISMSLGGGASTTTDNAVNSASNAGLVVVVAAGNDNANACNYSPARATGAITVGATTSADARSSFSNIGTCVNIFAPGSAITSTYIGSNTATASLSGTSMACPQVAGLAAYLWGYEGLSNAAAVRNRIIALAQSGAVSGPGTGSPNLLSQNGVATD